MQITVSNISTQQTVLLDVASDLTIADLKSLINAELSAQSPNPAAQLSLYHNGKLLGDPTKTITEAGIQDNDLVAAHSHPGPSSRGSRRPAPPQQQAQSSRDPPPGYGGGGRGGEQKEPDTEVIRLQVLGDPRLMEELRINQPELAGAINDPARFSHVFQLMDRQRREAEQQKDREIALLNDDPFNPDSQRRIAELIRQEQVMENLQSALEHNPEAFGKVIMLYINVEVNGHKVKAFVDSGAQATIMSPSCAEKCNIMRLVDSRFAGIARGVGTAKILGRVHSAQIKIGSLFLACSFTVMEGKSVDLLLGLDMLKRHQAKIDLERNCLVIQGTEVQFLGEADIPKNDEEWEREHEPTVEGPGGAKIGGRTGALVSGPQSEGGPSSTGGPSSQSPNFPTAGGPSGMLVRDTPGAYSNPPSGQPMQQQQQQQRPPPTAPVFPEEHINQLQALGFSREEAIAALQATNGDVEVAASLLFN